MAATAEKPIKVGDEKDLLGGFIDQQIEDPSIPDS
jgi:hypothetical protein